MKKSKIFDTLMAVNKKLLQLADELSQNEMDLEKLSLCVKSVKMIGDGICKLAKQKEEISQIDTEKEVKHAQVQVNTVFDIVLLEDMVQRARERFKEDLHLIEHHQNSVETIRKARAALQQMLQNKNEEAKHWHIPKTVNDHTLFSMDPLPHDAHNLKIFTKQMAEIQAET